MPTNIEEIIKRLSPAQREKVEDRARQLIADLQEPLKKLPKPLSPNRRPTRKNGENY